MNKVVREVWKSTLLEITHSGYEQGRSHI